MTVLTMFCCWWTEGKAADVGLGSRLVRGVVAVGA
jgi:hypothetical protein